MASELLLVAALVIGLGVIVGAAIAALSAYVLRYLSESPQHSRITALATALLSFAIADSLASEAGIVSVAVAGILLGNANIPYHEAVSEFKDDITVVVLGVVYVLLAALLTIEDPEHRTRQRPREARSESASRRHSSTCPRAREERRQDERRNGCTVRLSGGRDTLRLCVQE